LDRQGDFLPHDAGYYSAFYFEPVSEIAARVVAARLQILQIDSVRNLFVTSFNAARDCGSRFVTKQSHCQLKHLF
jgi:hypothetical protein